MNAKKALPVPYFGCHRFTKIINMLNISVLKYGLGIAYLRPWGNFFGTRPGFQGLL